MRAVILAAGRGRRLGREHPKCLLEIGGQTLLERQVGYLEARRIPITVVVGFGADQVRVALGERVTYVLNERFQEGSALSLACAGPAPGLVMDADLLYPASFLDRLLASPHADCLLADPSSGDTGEEVKVYLRDGRVVGLTKASLPDPYGESVGIFKFSGPTAQRLHDALDPAREYEPVLHDLLPHVNLGCEPVHEPWIEIDFPEDVERAHRLC